MNSERKHARKQPILERNLDERIGRLFTAHTHTQNSVPATQSLHFFFFLISRAHAAELYCWTNTGAENSGSNGCLLGCRLQTKLFDVQCREVIMFKNNKIFKVSFAEQLFLKHSNSELMRSLIISGSIRCAQVCFINRTETASDLSQR